MHRFSFRNRADPEDVMRAYRITTYWMIAWVTVSVLIDLILLFRRDPINPYELAVLNFILVFRPAAKWVSGKIALSRRRPDTLESPPNMATAPTPDAINDSTGEDVDEWFEEIWASVDERIAAFEKITTPFGEIRHVAIGKHYGIFLINGCAESGMAEIRDTGLLFDGLPSKTDYFAEIRSQCEWLSTQIRDCLGLEPDIVPILVLARAKLPQPDCAEEIKIVQKQDLPEAIMEEWSEDETKKQLWETREILQGALEKTAKDG